mmetsp:Transcript_29437/g.44575  ORF Transcript_29437/g.44575 Transcript_29437/m.44575 type:complete len:94 (+) Transcript_29437:961-1242(+)
MKIRDPDNTDLSTSTVVIALDTQREVDLGIGPHFTQRVLGKDEVIIFDQSLEYLGKEIDQYIELVLNFPFGSQGSKSDKQMLRSEEPSRNFRG